MTRQTRGSRVPFLQVLGWRGHSFLLSLGWIAVGLVLTFKIVQNVRVHAPVMMESPYVFRDDFNGAPRADMWKHMPVVGLIATAFYPNEQPSVIDGHLSMVLRQTKSFFYGRFGGYRGSFMATRFRFAPPFKVTARLRPASGPGVVAALFTYTDPLDGNSHFENDFEFPGATFARTGVWTNFYDPDQHHIFGLDKYVPIDFDAAKEFAEYELDVYPHRTIWKVNGKVIRDFTHRIAASPQRVFMNHWFGEHWPPIYETVVYDSRSTQFLVDWVQVESLDAATEPAP